ncbi:allergin-1 isoform X2 [Eublepharis macularius]|uniref:Allergin-1 isoform X2 n=1 Tax=Eublepharis macularius TaxID=481883 RepID=A0AA97JAJ4_EUBMA|nr:allergin-1 isoform X2 [Eublepharis macularius]
MLTFIFIGCILTAHFQPLLPDKEEDEPDENGSEPVSSPEIYSMSTEVSVGENVTLSCLSRTGSLPITYTLYKGRSKVLLPATKNKTGEAAEFHFPIHSSHELGVYKCKAKNNFSNDKYSPGFNFTMKAGERENKNLVVFIVLPLLLLLVAFVVAIPLLILPWCKARKLVKDISPTVYALASYPSSEHNVTYAAIAHEKDQEEYVNMEFETKKEKSRKVSFRDATTVVYSEIFRR